MTATVANIRQLCGKMAAQWKNIDCYNMQKRRLLPNRQFVAHISRTRANETFDEHQMMQKHDDARNENSEQYYPFDEQLSDVYLLRVELDVFGRQCLRANVMKRKKSSA